MKFSAALALATISYAAAAPDHGSDDESHSHDDGSVHPAVNCRNDICYSAVVPEATAQNGNGSIWFQIYAPTKFSWVAMGTGTGMANSNMFIMYQDGNGNVTISNRQANGHTMPQVPQGGGAKMQLLGGSGVNNGVMVANFRCDDCSSWKRSEELDFSSEGTPMIGAWSEGDSLDSNETDVSISKHTGSPRTFKLDLSKAQVSKAGNPFVGEHAIPAPLSEDDNNNTDSNNGNGDSGNNSPEDPAGAGNGKASLISGTVALVAVLFSMCLML
jgi:hypothetical protein